MTGKKFGCAFVIDQGEFKGIITDGDIRRNIDNDNLLHLTAQEVMSKNPLSIRKNALASEALGLMNSKNITSLAVVEKADSKKIVGIIHVHDLLAAGV